MSEDTIRSKYSMEAKPTFCPICTGSLEYSGLGEYRCEQCGATILDDFGKVRKFLEKNGPSPAVIISEGTGVPVSKINDFLKEGRIEIPDGSDVYIQCEKCGTEIRFGRFCPSCAAGLAKSIQGALVSGEVPKHKRSDGQGMHFLGKDRKNY